MRIVTSAASNKRGCFSTVLIIILVLALIGFITTFSSDDEKKSSDKASVKTEEFETSTDILNLSIDEFVDHVFKETEDAFIGDSLDVLYFEDGNILEIKGTCEQAFNFEKTYSKLVNIAFNTLKSASDPLRKDIQEVEMLISLPSTDVYGNKGELLAITVFFYRDTLEKINWEGFEVQNIPEAADVFLIAPPLREALEEEGLFY